MSVQVSRVRRVAGAATLTALVVTPVLLRAQHPAPAQDVKPASPTAPKTAMAPAKATQAGSFSELQAALERIQKRVTTSVGASSVPQTAIAALPKPPKPPDPNVKATPAPDKAATDKAAAADKPADKPAADKPATAAIAPRRIQLSWRSSLTWPAEIAPPSVTSRITLIWR